MKYFEQDIKIYNQSMNETGEMMLDKKFLLSDYYEIFM